MNLHADEKLFGEILRESSVYLGIPIHYLEKDYWVTKSLNKLSESEYSENIVFKGGTSLSKAHKIINRFSEDIDLAILDIEQSGNQIKRLLKKTENTMTEGLSYNENHPQESKKSSFRKTVYDYPKITNATDYGEVSNFILIEVNSFTKPVPFSQKVINSYIGEFLFEHNRSDLISKYDLHSFSLNTLDVERTLIEKIMGIVKYSYLEDYENVFLNKIRHFYDISLILRRDKYADFLKSDGAVKLLNDVVIAEDNIPGKFKKDWLKNPLSDAKIFTCSDAIVPKLSKYIQGDFRKMVFDQSLPDVDEITDILKNIWSTLSIYDKLRETT